MTSKRYTMFALLLANLRDGKTTAVACANAEHAEKLAKEFAEFCGAHGQPHQGARRQVEVNNTLAKFFAPSDKCTGQRRILDDKDHE